MTATHTPGPWKVETHPAHEPWITTAKETSWKPSVRIAVVNRDEDAALIAAAPELLEALKQAQRVLSLRLPPTSDIRDYTDGLISSAIAKAEGR